MEEKKVRRLVVDLGSKEDKIIYDAFIVYKQKIGLKSNSDTLRALLKSHLFEERED